MLLGFIRFMRTLGIREKTVIDTLLIGFQKNGFFDLKFTDDS